MKDVKRIIALLLALLCALSFAACSGEEGDGDTRTEGSTETPTESEATEAPKFEYDTTGGLCVITGVTDKTATTYVIPDFVTGIGEGAFDGCTALTSLTIPSGVTSIGKSAFAECTALTSVTFANTSGWTASDVRVSEDELADPAKAAELLTGSYCDKLWSNQNEWTPWY